MRELTPRPTGVTFISSDIKDRLVSYVMCLYLNVILSACFNTDVECVLGIYMRSLWVIERGEYGIRYCEQCAGEVE